MRIVKVGGKAQSDSRLAGSLASAWSEAPGEMCVVHGGGAEISDFQERLGLEPRMQNGRRITTSEDLVIVRMVLSGLANKRLVSALVRLGVQAVGISGEDGNLLCSDPRDTEKWGLVGETPTVNPGVLLALLEKNLLPVISPVSACSDATLSDSLNVNGDDAAAAIAIALEADELAFISDVASVRDAAGESLEMLDSASARELIRAGTAEGGMAAKLEAALVALEGGVASVRIGMFEMLRDAASGTLISSRTGVVR